MKRNKKAKWQLYTAIGIASVVVIGAAGILILDNHLSQQSRMSILSISLPKEGSVASSVLLSGTVTAKNEQYVYFDASKGDLDEIPRFSGDKVEEGQAALVKYSSADAKLPMMQPIEQLKADRHIEELNKARENASATPALHRFQQKAGLQQNKPVSAKSSVSSIDSQISDAKDNRADAVAQLNKAQAQLDACNCPLSTLEGTVVEVNHNVSKSPTGNSQVVVHVVSNENLQVKGNYLNTTLLIFLLGKKLPLLRRFTKIRAGQVKSAIFLIILKQRGSSKCSP